MHHVVSDARFNGKPGQPMHCIAVEAFRTTRVDSWGTRRIVYKACFIL